MKDLEDIIKEVGGDGPFQKRLLYLVLSPLFFLLPLSWMSDIFFLSIPDYWCYHPMTQNFNSTELEAWKKCFLIENEDGSYDGCKIPLPNLSDPNVLWSMNISSELLFDETSCRLNKFNSINGIKDIDIVNSSCKRGWAFDHSEFKRTIPIDQEWVCDDNHDYVADLYTYGSVGSIIGGALFSFIGDRFGRRLTFWITTAMICIFMTAKTFLSDYYEIYVIFKIIASACFISTYQLPATLIAEVAATEYRSWTILVSWMMWFFGLCLLPLIAWLTADWFLLSLITSPLMLITFIGWKFVPESPRWLLSRPDRINESMEIFQEIAKVNKRSEPQNLENRLKKINEEIMKEKHYGYISLFSSKGLTLKTILMTVTSFCSIYTYTQLTLNIGNMGGNTFVNFFLLAVIEGPATYLGLIFADKVGRRWSHTITLSFNTIVLAATVCIANHHEEDLTSQWSVSILCMIAKFNCTMAFYFYYLQSIELFPTCIRNSGLGFIGTMASIIGLCGPHITGLGAKDKRIPVGVMGLINFVAAIASSFLPETVGCDLPETLEAATVYGSDQSYFSYVKDGKIINFHSVSKRSRVQNIKK